GARGLVARATTVRVARRDREVQGGAVPAGGGCAAQVAAAAVALLPDYENREGPRDHRGLGAATATGGRGRCRTSLYAHHIDVAGRRIEGQRPRPIHGLQILFDDERGRTRLLHHGERSVALRAE